MKVRFPGILKNDRRGMALLITIMVVSLLVAVTIQFNRNVRQTFFASTVFLEGQKLQAAARSGLVVASALLEVDGAGSEPFDSLQDSWAELDATDLQELIPEGRITLKITDLSGRLQVNSLVAAENGPNVNNSKEILKRLLTSGTFGVETAERSEEIVNALVDWLDEDDEELEFGAESGYYRSLAEPYACRNGPIRDIDELLLVRGISPELLHGVDDRPGLADFLTVHGTDGKINLNTAPGPLLAALHPLMDLELAQLLTEYRLEEENLSVLNGIAWYRNVVPGDIELPEDALTVKSHFFLVESTGHHNERSERIMAVVERKDDNSTVIVGKKVE